MRKKMEIKMKIKLKKEMTNTVKCMQRISFSEHRI